MGNAESQGAGETHQERPAWAEWRKEDRSSPNGLDDQETIEADVRFRQLYRNLAQETQPQTTLRELEFLVEETARGRGFIARISRAGHRHQTLEGEGTLPELRVIQRCLLSDDETIMQMACRVLASLKPASTEVIAWFGIAKEHIAWARSHPNNLEATNVIALETLCTPSIVEDIRSLVVSDYSRKTRLAAMEALATVLLHPANRAPHLFSERDLRFLSETGIGEGHNKSDDEEENQKLMRLSLEVLEAWSFGWSSDAVLFAENNNPTQTPSPRHIGDRPPLPPAARALAFRLVRLVEKEGASSAQSEIAVRILYHLDVASVLADRRVVLALAKSLSKGLSTPRARFFTAMLLLRAVNASSTLVTRSDLDGVMVPKGANPGADDVAILALLACVRGFAAYDSKLHRALNHMNAKSIWAQKGQGVFLERFVARTICITCASVFATRFADTALSLPRSVSLSYVHALEHGDDRIFGLINVVLARSERRDFARQAIDDGAALFFQNSAAQFMYPSSETTRAHSVHCLEHLVANFASHDLGAERSRVLYEFLLARVREAEALERTGYHNDEFNDSKAMRQLVSDYLFYGRMGLALTYQHGYERGPFLVDIPTEAMDSDPEDDGEEDQEEAPVQKGQQLRGKAEVFLKSWSESAPESSFLERVFSLFLDDESRIQFAALQTLIRLAQTSEGARRAILHMVADRPSDDLRIDDLSLLLALVSKPNGSVLWLDEGVALNRSGGEADICADEGDSYLVSVFGADDAYHAGARLVHCELGPGLVVDDRENAKGEHATVDVSFDSSKAVQSILKAELDMKTRPVMHSDGIPASLPSWTMIVRTTAFELDNAAQILAQAGNGDVLVGIRDKRLGCYDAAQRKWYASSMFLPTEKPQTLVVVASNHCTSFLLFDDSFSLWEMSFVEFTSDKPPLTLCNSIEGAHAFRGLAQFVYFPWAWPEREIPYLLATLDITTDSARAIVARNPSLVSRLVGKLRSVSVTTVERRMAAEVLFNLALCPTVRLDLIHALSPILDGLLVEDANRAGDEEAKEGGSKAEPFLDWHIKARLLSALA